MRVVFAYLKPYRLAVAVAITLMLIELSVELLQPYLIAKIIDEGIQPGDLTVALRWGAVLLACSLAAFGVGIFSSFYAAHVSQKFGFDLREALYEKIQSFSFASFGKFAESSLITRLTNDIVQLQNTVFMGLRIMLRAPLFVFGSVIMALVVNPLLALWLVGAMPLLALFLGWVLKRGERLFRSVQGRLDTVNAVMQQNLIGMRLARIFVRIRHETARFTEAGDELMTLTVAALRLTELTMPVILLVMNAGIIGLLWFGRVELETGGATVGEIVAVMNYATRATGALSLMSMIVVNFSRAKASASRTGEVLSTESDMKETDSDGDAPAVSRGEIVFDDVAFRYPDTGEAVLSDVSFRASPGETIAIMGATGSGKTSLLQLVPRLYDTESGVVRIDGRDAREFRLERLREQIGYVPQEVVLFSGTVTDNVRWGKTDATMSEVMEACRLAQIHDTIMKLPQQYDTVIGQKGVNLSGGQKQRMTIARALVRKPVVLLLDDCTSALDVHTESALLQALKEVRCTTLLVTQKVSSTLSADRILLLDDGRLIASGTHETLIKDSDLYRRIYDSQFGREGVPHA